MPERLCEVCHAEISRTPDDKPGKVERLPAPPEPPEPATDLVDRLMAVRLCPEGHPMVPDGLPYWLCPQCQSSFVVRDVQP